MVASDPTGRDLGAPARGETPSVVAGRGNDRGSTSEAI